jgi:hypothetical protein
VRIINFFAENVKKLRCVEITPGDASVVQITGANGAGKSSILDAIFYALAGTKDIPSQPIRKGAAKASIKLDLGEMVVTRRFTQAGTSLVVESKEGVKFPSPQAMLDTLLSGMSFDPLAFTRLIPEKQLEQLKSLVKLDVDVDKLDSLNQRDYDARTLINRDAKALEARLKAMPVASGLLEKPVDLSALMTEMREGAADNQQAEKAKAAQEAKFDEISRMYDTVTERRDLAQQRRTEAEGLMEQAKKLEAQAAKIELDAQDAEAVYSGMSDGSGLTVDLSAIQQRIEEGQRLNKQLEAAVAREKVQEELSAAKAKADKLTKAMEQREEQKRTAIAAAKMPVVGLSFGDGEVTYNGLPMSQASSAEQLRVSTAIAMQLNPKLRVLRIADGSLLDESNMRMLADMATAEDFQLWIETVKANGPVTVEMEDGSVKEAE